MSKITLEKMAGREPIAYILTKKEFTEYAEIMCPDEWKGITKKVCVQSSVDIGVLMFRGQFVISEDYLKQRLKKHQKVQNESH